MYFLLFKKDHFAINSFIELKIAEFRMDINLVVDIDKSGILSFCRMPNLEFLFVSPLVSVLYA